LVNIRWRQVNRVLHRDIGYLCVGMTVIYGLSGIALNHLDDWNPSYSLTRANVEWPEIVRDPEVSKEQVLGFLEGLGERDGYKKHYHPQPGMLKVFLVGGSLVVDLESGNGVLEKLERRPIFYEVNFLHYNPKGLWTWFSDLFCGALMVVAITGLFVIKGNKGITGRGAWLTGLGVLLPLAFLVMYL
jgi:hypothetical protein